MDDEDDFEQRSAEFLAWFRAQDGTTISPKIEVADLRAHGAGRGVIAVEDIDEGEELFSIPQTTVLSVRNSELQTHIPAKLAEMDPWLSLVLVMIHDSGKGQDSKWWPYWRILPDKFDTLVHWSQPELSELQASAVVTKIGREDADAAFIDSLLPIATEHAALFGTHASQFSNHGARAYLLELAHHMASLIMAYAFDIEKDEAARDPDEDGFVSDDEENPPKGLVCFADLLNANGEKNNARLYHVEMFLTMIAVKTITKGEEILNDYGPLPRSDLLRRYGYLSDDYKQWDVVEINTSEIIEAVTADLKLTSGEVDARACISQDWDVWEESFDLTRQIGNSSLPYDGFDPAFVLTLRVLTANEIDYKSLRSAKKVPEPEMDVKIASVLRKVIIKRQEEYCTSVAQDAMLLRNAELNARHRMAIEVRLGEKEILAATLQYLDRQIESLSEELAVSKDHSAEEEARQGQGHNGMKRRKI